MKIKSSSKRLLCLFITLIMLSSGLPNLSCISMADNDYRNGDRRSDEIQSEYTMAELKDLEYDELIDVIIQLEWKDITDLFQNNEDAVEFYNDSDRMDALLDEIEDLAEDYDGTDSQGLITLIEVTRAGYYLASESEDLEHLDSEDEREKTEDAIFALVGNENFNFETSENSKLVEVTGKFINNTACPLDLVDDIVSVIESFNDNIETYTADDDDDENDDDDVDDDERNQDARIGMDKLVNGVIIGIENATHGQDPEDTEYYGELEDFISEIEEMLIFDEVTENKELIIDGAIYYICQLIDFRRNESLTNKALTEVMDHYEVLSVEYLKAADSINYYFDGIDYYGNDLDYEQMLEDAFEHYLPERYIFDDGKVVMYVGGDVTRRKIEKLYWSMGEVESQFFRAYGNDVARDDDHGDEVLTIYIYNSPYEYGANRVLKGYSTDNGGIYIEKKGSMYTYEREADESKFTLEELFRHEYTHYLQGRYLVKGYWGVAEIYDDDYFVWYDEGAAELFAGSNQRSGIIDRNSLLYYLNKKEPESWLSLNEILSLNNYENDVYTFGFTFLSFMFNERRDLFDDFSDYILDDDAEGFYELVEELKYDRDLNDDYQDYMEELNEAYDEDAVYEELSDAYLVDHEDRTLETIESDILRITDLTDVETDALKSDLVNAFRLRGTYTGGRSRGESRDRSEMEEIVVDYLDDLADLEWSGYDTLTCYYVNHRKDEDGNMQFDVVFKGILTDTIRNRGPEAVITAHENGVLNDEMLFIGSDSIDPDGLIVEYEWDFGDGRRSSEQNPLHTFTRLGDYEVELTVEDYDGARDTASMTLEITRYPAPIIEEYAKNGEPSNANRGVCDGLPVTGHLGGDDFDDYFKFEVLESGEIEIIVDVSDEDEAAEMAWTLYEEDDLYNFVEWDQRDGSRLYKTYDADPGMYYLDIHYYGSNEADYTLTVNGSIPENTNPEFDDLVGSGPSLNSSQAQNQNQNENQAVGVLEEEFENNDSAQTANAGVCNGVEVTGQLTSDDTNDFFAIEVLRDGQIEIEVEFSGSREVMWYLFSENDLRDYEAYGSRDGDVLKDSYNADEGLYYLNVYNYSGRTVDYTITVTGDIASAADQSSNSRGSRRESGDLQYEQEDNDDFEDAQSINLGDTLVGSLEDNDYRDIFYFDVDNDCTLDIVVDVERGDGVEWLLFEEHDTENFVAYPSSRREDLSAEYEADRGRYFIKVYNYGSWEGEYELTITEN